MDLDNIDLFHYNYHGYEVLKRVRACVENELLCDVVLIAGNDGMRISAHRLILLGNSEYFYAMFTGPHTESRQKEITLVNIDSYSLGVLVRYCYTGWLQLTEKTVETLLTSANYLHMNSVVEACCDYLMQRMHPANCLGFSYFAAQHNFRNLFKDTHKYICQHFVEITNNAEFLKLEIDELIAIINEDELHVPSEELVFIAVKKWIDYDPEERRKYIADLLVNIRLSLLKPAYILENVEPICDTAEAKDLVLRSLKWHLLPQLRRFTNHYPEMKTSPRNIHHIFLALPNTEGPYGVKIYDSLSWNTRLSPLKELKNYAVAAMNNLVVISGGQINDEVSSNVMVLDFYTMETRQLCPMILHREKHVMASHNGFLYVIGGDSVGEITTNTLEIWSEVNEVWGLGMPIPTARSCAAIGAIGDFLYVVGGKNNSYNTLSTVECYHVVEKNWYSKKPLHYPRYRHGAAVANGYLYVFGGLGTENSLEIYDPTTDVWTFLVLPSNLYCSNCTRRSDLSCTSVGTKIYTACCTKYVQEYDTLTNRWKGLPSSSTTSYHVTLVTIPYDVCFSE